MIRRIGTKRSLWFGTLAVIVLVGGLTVPGLAAPSGVKNFSFTVGPPSVAQGAQDQTFTITVTNTSPRGSSSNISSLSVTVPDEIDVQSASVAPRPASDNANADAVVTIGTDGATCRNGDDQTVNVCSTDPLKRLQKIAITIVADVTGSCQDPSGAWAVAANTGSQLNGDAFAENPVNPNPTTTIECPNATISGQVWRDHDNDGQRDTDENGQSGWTVKAFDGTTEAGSDSTDADGDYVIPGLVTGATYTVCEFAPAEEPGFEYRGWTQSVPDDADDLCAGVADAEPNGHSVTIPGSGASEDVDFFNVRTITVGDPIEVDCDNLPPDGIFTVGDGINDPIGTIQVDPEACKPGEYVFETWVSGNEQFAEFYPTFDTSGTPLVPFVETYEWVINDNRTQQTLFYDDDGDGGVPEREMLFCVVDTQGNFAAFPGPVSPDTAPHTSCLLSTTEVPTGTGVLRHDTVYTEIDGARKIR